MALSTIEPATSPRLSAIRIDFFSTSSPISPVDASIEGTGGELQRVADEVSRIEREFGGAVRLTVLRDPPIEAVFTALNVGFLLPVFCSLVDSLSSIPLRSFNILNAEIAWMTFESHRLRSRDPIILCNANRKNRAGPCSA